MKVVVTGANGWLGAAVCRELERRHPAGRSAGILPADEPPGRRRPGRLEAGAPNVVGLTRADADVGDLAAVRAAMPSADVLIHTAGLAHQFQGASAEAFHRINAIGTENVVRAATERGIPRIVVVSSASVYGSSDYGSSKLEGEQRARAIAPVTILRMSTLYGPGDKGNIFRLMRQIDRRRFVWVGRGENRKSLIYVDDAARACVLAASAPPDTFDVAPPPHAMREIVETLAAVLGRRLPPVRVPAFAARLAPPPIRNTLMTFLREDVLDGSRFARELGWSAQTGLAAGLAEEVAWYRSAGF